MTTILRGAVCQHRSLEKGAATPHFWASQQSCNASACVSVNSSFAAQMPSPAKCSSASNIPPDQSQSSQGSIKVGISDFPSQKRNLRNSDFEGASTASAQMFTSSPSRVVEVKNVDTSTKSPKVDIFDSDDFASKDPLLFAARVPESCSHQRGRELD